MGGQGSWIATATDLVRFLVRVDTLASPPDLLSAATIKQATTATPQSLAAVDSAYGMGWTANTPNAWYHNGALAGTASEISRVSDGITSYAVITNSNTASGVGANLEGMVFDAMKGVTSWPTCDLFSSNP